MDLLSRLARHVALAAPFVSVGVTNRDKRSSFVPVATPGTKGHPLLSRTGVPGWETGTTAVSQPGQINVFVVVSSSCVHWRAHLVIVISKVRLHIVCTNATCYISRYGQVHYYEKDL